MSARIISVVGRAIDVIVAGRLVSHLCLAAGVCVLAAGLLMGSAGGAVAVADTDSSGSAAPGDGGTNASGQGSTTASSPVGNVTDTRRKTIQRVTSTFGSGRQPGQQPSTGAKSPRQEPGGTDTEDEKKDSGVAAAVRDLVAAVTNVVAPVTNVVAPVTNVVAPVTNVVAPVPNVVAPVPNVVAPVSNVVAPATNVVAPVPNLVAPVSDVIAPVTNMVARVSDVITPVQDMLTSVGGAVVPLTQLQSDLSSFLLGIAGVEPVEGGLGGIHGAGLSATAGASVASQLRLARPLSGVPAVPVAANTGTATLGGIFASISGAMSEAGTSVIAARDGTASAQWRHSDGCAVVSPACPPRPPGSPFAGGAGRCRSARRRRACDPYPGRGAHRLPPGQSRLRIADSGHRALRRSGAVRCRPIGVIGCRPSAGIARRPRCGSSR